MKKDDFGFYGKGLDGYVHYKQAFDETQHRTGSDRDTDTDTDLDEYSRPPISPAQPPAHSRTRRPGEVTGWQLAGVTAAALLLIVLLMQCG